MQLVEVNTPELANEFLMVLVRLYKNDPNFIRPLDKDVNDVFNPRKNKLLKASEAVRWLLQDDSGKYIGRVAAFINKKTANTFEQPTGGMGFFDCINDQAAANMLLDACKNWLQERGMEAMDGPINFGERDKWWGVLADGFTPPNYGMHYNYPYYTELLENYGFQLFFKQFTYYRTVEDPLPPEYKEKADRILRENKYSFRHLDKKQLNKYAEDFRTVYNKGWAKFEGVKPMSEAQSQQIMKSMRPVLDERIMWFAYYEDQPVGFFIALPELNQLFKYVDGKLDWWGKLKFAFHRWRGACKTMYGIVFGITPEHQGKGLEAALVTASGQLIQNNPKIPYTDFQMNWIGDFNPKMMRLVEKVGSRIYKTHHTYRYLFDRTKPFTRARIIDK
jgi:GNAT superfamily N-acetyltransferase